MQQGRYSRSTLKHNVVSVDGYLDTNGDWVSSRSPIGYVIDLHVKKLMRADIMTVGTCTAVICE